MKPERDPAVYEAIAHLLERDRQQRRPLWQVALAFVAGVALAACGALGALAYARAHPAVALYTVTAGSSQAPFLLPATAAPAKPTGVVRSFELTAAPATWELYPGRTVEAWLFNGVSPGPTIVVHAGDTVKVHVVNHLAEPLAISWHGVELPYDQAGLPGMSQAPIWPGHDFTYTFVASRPGTYFYHSMYDMLRQVDYGLYGALIVLPPADAAGQPKFDVDQTLVLGEWPAPGDYNAETPTFFTINGRSYPATQPVWVRQGDRVRLRLINASGMETHSIHLTGGTFWLIARDGNPLAVPEELNTVDLTPGQTADIAFVANNPGNWVLWCHMLEHVQNMYGPGMGGMAVLIRYHGFNGGMPPADNELAQAQLHLFDVRSDLAAGRQQQAKSDYSAFTAAWQAVGRDVEQVDPGDALKIDQVIAMTAPAWQQGPPALPDALQRLDDVVQQTINNINQSMVGMPHP